MIFIIDNKKI